MTFEENCQIKQIVSITGCYRAIGLQGYSVVNNPEQYLLSNVGSTSPLCSRSVGGHFPRTFHCVLI